MEAKASASVSEDSEFSFCHLQLWMGRIVAWKTRTRFIPKISKILVWMTFLGIISTYIFERCFFLIELQVIT